MGAVQLADELQRVIDRQVEDGRAASAAAFLEEAVLRLVDDAASEEDEIRSLAQAGMADIQAGRHVTVATAQDEQDLHARLMARLRDRLAVHP